MSYEVKSVVPPTARFDISRNVPRARHSAVAESDCESAQALLDSEDATLAEVRHTVAVPPQDGKAWRKIVAYAGPGVLVAVGYVDPGNWSTGLAAGSQFGYNLLCIVLMSSLIAILLQALSLRLGVVTGRDLAQTCRDRFHPRVTIALWLVSEAAIVATDLAEVIGSAIALNLLFGLPLVWGVLVTVADVLVLLLLMRFGWRFIEAFVALLMGLIAACFIFEVATANPAVNWGDAGMGYLPRGKVVSNSEALYLAVGIIGATVMPHNLFLHSSIIQTRSLPEDQLRAAPSGAAVAATAAAAPAVAAFGTSPQRLAAVKEAVKFGTVDSTLSLFVAFLVNSSIVIVAAAVFYSSGETDVAEIQDAYQLLTPAMGKAASTVFAVALLAAGQNATLTCTLAGQIVMEGFVKLRIKPWQRRLISRALAVVPAAVIASLSGQSGLAQLLTLSQVILSLALPFAVFPLIMFTGNRELMGEFAAKGVVKAIAWSAALLISGLNVKLIVDTALGR